LLRSTLVSSRFVGDFDEGDAYHHGATQVTPLRNREYINKYNDGLLLGENGKTFQDFKIGDIYRGTFEEQINLVDFSRRQIATANDAAVRHNPTSTFIRCGGAVKAMAEAVLSGHFSLAYHLGMNIGAHNAPAYAPEIAKLLFANGVENEREKIRSKIEVIDTAPMVGRNYTDVIMIKLTGEKCVTDGGMRALEAAAFGRMDQIFEETGKRFLRVLTSEQVLAVPTTKAFV
jgi:hypothetical protein